jgi:hypothetical protein
MMKPTIHLNGTSKNELYRQLQEAHAALQDAQRMLAEAGPNARDYYLQGSDAIYRAQDEHYARMLKLTEVSKDLEELMDHVVG